MASKAAHIPRFLLPQYGPIWRAHTRTPTLARPLNAELRHRRVRYGYNKAAAAAKKEAEAESKPTKTKTPKVAATKSTTKKTSATKAKSTTTKRAASTSTTKAASSRASVPKTAPTAEPVTKASAAKASTPKTPTSRSAAKTTPAAKAVAPEPVASEPPAQTAVPESPVPPTTEAPKTSALKTKAPAADPSEPFVLEKPDKFRPPSHGARLPRSTPKHYGGSLTAEEVQTQKEKHYPGLPPPENSWSYWLLHNRSIHLVITLGTLTSLAVYTFAANFKATSPFADMIPPGSEFTSHPIEYMRTVLEVLRLDAQHESAVVAEKRARKVDDVAKRNAYRKAHGLAVEQGFESQSESPDTADAAPVPTPAHAPVEVGEVVKTKELDSEPHDTPESKRKKFLGIF